jgi:hypothetical protein
LITASLTVSLLMILFFRLAGVLSIILCKIFSFITCFLLLCNISCFVCLSP